MPWQSRLHWEVLFTQFKERRFIIVNNNNNSNNNNVTCIAQIRQDRKCATTSNRNVFSRFLNVASDKSVDRRSCGRVPHDGTMNGETAVTVTCVRGECRQIAGDADQHRMTSTCSTLWDTVAPDRGYTCTRWLLSWTWSDAEQIASADYAELASYALTLSLQIAQTKTGEDLRRCLGITARNANSSWSHHCQGTAATDWVASTRKQIYLLRWMPLGFYWILKEKKQNGRLSRLVKFQ